jgi:AcrR family transcriptional regulator
MRNGTKKVPVPSKRPRGRPRSFDEAEALAALTRTFWVHGFAAASLDELAASAGINRPSLYATFGDKRAMYLRAVAEVTSRLEAAMERSLSPERPLADALAAFYAESIEQYSSGEPGPRGCFVVCTAPSAAVDEPEIKRALAGVLRTIDRGFEKPIAAARDRGELPPHADPRMLAMLAASALHSLAIRARAGESRARLVELSRAAVELILGVRPRDSDSAARRGRA